MNTKENGNILMVLALLLGLGISTYVTGKLILAMKKELDELLSGNE